MALPAPVGADKPSNYEGEQAEEELGRITSALSAVGIELSNEEFAELSMGAARRILAARKAALRPFQPYYSLAGTRQGYRMFSGVALVSDRLWVEAERDGRWETLYLARDPAHDWRGLALDHEQTRSLLYSYPSRRYRRRWKAFSQMLAEQVAVDIPEATRVRVSWKHARVQTPRQSRRGEEPRESRRGERTVRLDR